MRKVTQRTMMNFAEGVKATSGNTAVTGYTNANGHNVYEVHLHGNTIAHRDETGIWLNFKGYNTVTTRERLNGLIEICNFKNLYLVQHKFDLYLATFKDGKRLLKPLDENKWYEVYDLNQTAQAMRDNAE